MRNVGDGPATYHVVMFQPAAEKTKMIVALTFRTVTANHLPSSPNLPALVRSTFGL